MVEKMKFINLTGPSGEIDRAMEEYLSRYSVQLEYAVKELKNEKELTSFTGQNPYALPLKKAEGLRRAFGIEEGELSDAPYNYCLTKDRAMEIIEEASAYLEGRSKGLRDMSAQKDELLAAADEYEHFAEIAFNVEDLAGFEFLRYHFGRMPLSSFKQFESALYESPEILFVTGKDDGKSLWCIYFTTALSYDKVESIFSSLHFEKARLPSAVGELTLKGKPSEICVQLRNEAEKLDRRIKEQVTAEINAEAGMEYTKEDVLQAYRKINSMNLCFDARKFAAQTTNRFFIYVGWMAERDAEKLKKELEDDKSLSLIIEDDNDSIVSYPPIKLKNPRFLRPFEFFVRMYGLPGYKEMDPTPFVAFTYSILFGIMFADAGQGLVISLLGLMLGIKRKMALGKVMVVIGMVSIVTGIMFGSFFGYEFTPLLIHPAEPDNLMNILMYAVAIGIMLIVTSIVFNIANGIKQKRYIETALSPNGLPGLVFFGFAAYGATIMLSGGDIPTPVIAAVAAPLVIVAVSKPLATLLKGQKVRIHGNPALYAFETVIELFETVLSYFTNTVSFLRVGAFAISHASIMGIVWTLSKTAAGSNSPVVLIFGNLLVVALEGLIVGIQVLRLEFYEMFSRFYGGGGKEFKPTSGRAAQHGYH